MAKLTSCKPTGNVEVTAFNLRLTSRNNNRHDAFSGTNIGRKHRGPVAAIKAVGFEASHSDDDDSINVNLVFHANDHGIHH